MADAKRDSNYVPTLIAVSNADGTTPVTLYADPTTHRLLTSTTAGALDDLSDVIITSAGTADLLYYTGTAWVNLPAGVSGTFLKTNGTASAPQWATPTAGAAGSDTQVQFNDGGSSLGGDAGFTYNKTTNVITVDGISTGSATITSLQAGTASITSNTGLRVADTNASHYLIFAPGSDLTANRTLTITTGDGDRTLDISAGSVTISGFGATLVDDANAAAARTTLGLVIGTDVQAYDAQLTDIAGLTPTGSTFIEGNGSNFVSRTAAEVRGDLGLVIGTNVQAWDADLDAIAALSGTAFAVRTGTNTWAQRTLTGTTNQISISNPDGVSGNPTFSTPQDIATTSTPQFARLGLGAAASGTATALINLNTGGNIVVGDQRPKRTIVLSGAGGWPSTTSGATGPIKTEMSTNKDNYQLIQFNPAATAYCEWTVAMPDNYDGDTVTAQFYWTLNDTTGSAVVWQLAGASVADNESLDIAFGTSQSVTDSHNSAAYKLDVSAATPPITLAGTPAGGELVQFRVKRAAGVGADTAATAYLLAVKLEYGVNAYSD